MTTNMTTGSPMKLMLKFAIPLLLGNLFQQLYNMVDTIIVGRRLGALALAGVGATSSVQFLVFGFCIGVTSGFAIPIAQRFGANDYHDMRRYIYNAAISTGVLALTVTLLTTLLTHVILHLLRTPQDIYQDAYTYIFIIFAGIPFTLLYNVLASILRAVGDSRTPFIFLIISSFINIGLDLFFIIFLGIGVAGAALATIIAQAISGICCFILILKKYDILWIRKEDRGVDGKHIRILVAMGVPMGLQFSITAIGSMVMQSANNGLGSVYVSGFTAATKIKQLTMCPFDAFASAASTFASQNYGAGNTERIKKGIVEGVIMGMTYGIFIGVVMILFGRRMSMMFVDSSEVAILDAAGLFIQRLGMFYWVLGILNVTRMTIQGLGYSGKTIFSGVSEMIARTLVGIVFVPIFGFNAITFCDQIAWLSAVCYIVPTCIHVVHITTQKFEKKPEIQ